MHKPSSRLATKFALRLSVAAAAALTLTLTACGDRQDGKGTAQVAAKVNSNEISIQQISLALQSQRGLKPEQLEAAGRQVLERLIDQQLALQKADELKLAAEPQVALQIEAARREVLARAYADKLGERAAKPTPEDVKKYYDSKPALFSERRIYNIQEIGVEAKPDQIPVLRDKLKAVKNIAEFIEYLKANDYKFVGNQAVRSAEQLPLQNLDAFARMTDGQAVIGPASNGVQVVVLAGSRSQPVTETQARPAIEQYLLNERKRKLVEDDIKAMRAAAKIEYAGKFAPAASAAAANPVAAPAASAASQ